jgi:hypothetical protein
MDDSRERPIVGGTRPWDVCRVWPCDGADEYAAWRIGEVQR